VEEGLIEGFESFQTICLNLKEFTPVIVRDHLCKLT
jgi:hypothetical protein